MVDQVVSLKDPFLAHYLSKQKLAKPRVAQSVLLVKE